MDIFFVCILAALFSYVIGSIPIAYLVGRKVESVDVREVGEGNVGARNVFHTVGHKWGSLVFLGEIGRASCRERV